MHEEKRLFLDSMNVFGMFATSRNHAPAAAVTSGLRERFTGLELSAIDPATLIAIITGIIGLVVTLLGNPAGLTGIIKQINAFLAQLSGLLPFPIPPLPVPPTPAQ